MNTSRTQQNFFFANTPARQRPIFCAHHMPVDVTVGVVIDRATRRPHQKDADNKNQQYP